MSNIPLARAILIEARASYSMHDLRVGIQRALRLMRRERSKQRLRSKLTARFTPAIRQKILAYRRRGWSQPDIALALRLNSRVVSHVINGKRP